MKRTIFVIFSAILILIAGVGLYFGIKGLNSQRIAVAKTLEQKVKDVSGQQKIMYLIESDILSPKETKKAAIAELYLEAGKTKEATEYLEKIKNDRIKDEITYYQDLSSGNYRSMELLSWEPITNSGKILVMVRDNNYSGYIVDSSLGVSIKQIIDSGSDKDNQKLNLAQLFLNLDQPHISIYLLKNSGLDSNCATAYFSLLEKAYEKVNDQKKALATIEAAIGCNPVDLDLLEKALGLSRALKNTAKTSLYQARIDALK